MNLTPEQAATLAGHSSSSIGGESVVDSARLAKLLRPATAARGFRSYDDGDRPHLFRVADDGTARRALFAELADAVGELALDAVEAAAEQAVEVRHRQRATRTARLIRRGAASGYLRRVSLAVRDTLDEPTDAEIASAREATRIEQRAARANPEARERRTAADAARRESDREHARRILAAWLTRWQPGRYAVGDVWEAWSRALRDAPQLHGTGASRLGRTRFYELLAELGDVRPTGARRRVLVIAAKAVEAVVERVAATAASWLDAIRSRLSSGTAEGKRDALYLQRARREAEAAGRPLAELPDLDELRAEGRARIAATRAVRAEEATR